MRAAIRASLALALAFGMVVPAAGAQDVRPTGLPEPVLESIAALGAHPDVLAAAEDGDLERDISYLRPVNDLDGDGLPDVLAVASGQEPDRRELSLTARRGTDGEILWQTVLPTSGLFALVPASVGAGGDNGLLLVTYYGLAGGLWQPRAGEDPWGFRTSGAAMQLAITAVAGDGSAVWSRVYEPGYFAYSPDGSLRASQNLAIVAGALDATGSSATDLLVGLYDRVPDGEQTLRTLVVDGADGSDAPGATLDISDAYTELVVLEDLTGDGLDDYGVLMFPDDAETAELRTFAGVDGSALWSATVPDHPRLLAEPAGDVTGDGRSDVVVAPYHTYSAQSSQPYPAVVLAGADGGTVLSVAADEVRPLGDLTGDGRSDLVTLTVIRGEDVVGADVAAYRADGSTIYSARHAVPRETGISRVQLGAVGDVDDDGVADVTVAPSGTGLAGPVTHVVSGRTGALLRTGPLEGRPAVASISGAGDDLVSTVAWGGSSRDVTAFDGLTGAALWHTRLRTPGDSSSDSWAASDLNGDGLADLVVNVRWSTVEYDLYQVALFPESSTYGYVLDGADGSVLWQTDLTPEPPTPPATAGTVAATQPFTWDGAEATGATALGPIRPCSIDDPVFRCEHVLVEVVGGSHAQAAVTLSDFNELTTDLDLYVYESDEHGTKGPYIGGSGNWFDTPGEHFEFPVGGAGSRFFLVEVTYYSNPTMSGYKGTFELLS